MKVNLFAIPEVEIESLRQHLLKTGMSVVKHVEQDGWGGDFYFSADPSPSDIPWVETFAPYLTDLDEVPKNRTFYAVFLFTKDDHCFALSYGKSHFYIRPYCDYDFGIELAKRISDEDDIRQTASKRFAGRRTKDIKSFAAASRLNVESGESVDYLQGAIVEADRDTFGSFGKFGTSAQVTPDIGRDELGMFLTKLVARMAEQPRFKLPRTTIVTEADEAARLDAQLLDELEAPIGTSEFSHNTYDLYGVDFIFSSDGKFVLRYGRNKHELDSLTMKDLKTFIKENRIARDQILNIKVTRSPEGANSYTQKLRDCIDFIPDDDRVLLSNGKWMRFNQDYLDFLDSYLRTIEVEATEPELAEIYAEEGAFNESDAVAAAGYTVADKDFDILKTRARTPIEAWDLRKGDTVYAVKFGTAQKLGYVADQALNVLHLLYNKAEVQEVPQFQRYCLWLGYRGKSRPESIDKVRSVILKQKIDAWARKAEDLGIVPVIKISRKLKAGVDDQANSTDE